MDELQRAQRFTIEDYDYFYYPNKGKLVTNALLACFNDSSIYVNRYSLDFLISHMPILNPEYLNEEMSITIVESVLYLITKKEFACLKKFSTWLLSHLDEEEEQIDYE